MTKKLKVTMDKIYVRDNGEAPGKGELYWALSADDVPIEQLSPKEARKTGDGETIHLGNSVTLSKASDASLTVLGSVSEADAALKGADDTRSFRNVFSSADNWGIGSHTVKLSDGKHLDVTVYYTISAA